MYLDWTKHLKDPEEKARFENQVISSKQVLDRLKELIKEKETQLQSQEIDPNGFDNPNWGLRQASLVGSKTSLAWVYKLINLDQQRIINER